MKRLILAAALTFAATVAQAQYTGTGSNPNSHGVSGYTTNSGTYVPPHVRFIRKARRWTTTGARAA